MDKQLRLLFWSLLTSELRPALAHCGIVVAERAAVEQELVSPVARRFIERAFALAREYDVNLISSVLVVLAFCAEHTADVAQELGVPASTVLRQKDYLAKNLPKDG